MIELGKWAVIDIETTGIDPSYDAIIDLGFLEFEGTKLVNKFSSVVRTDHPISKFIQKLTGLKESEIRKAPRWEDIEHELLELKGCALLAHNSAFEEKFLQRYFDKLGGDDTYCDSIPFLALMYPEKSSLNLESFIIELGIAQKELHRGLADSIDLLKVLLISVSLAHSDIEFSTFLVEQMDKLPKEEFWYKDFFKLDSEQLLEIADQIDFDLNAAVEKCKEAQINKDAGTYTKGHGYPMKFDSANIKHILGDEGELKKFIPEYKYRASQESMSLRIGQAFGNGIHALVQAPTGTGKTLGYLLPSALLSKSSENQVLVATGTKALQNQAIGKDIPLLANMLGLDKKSINAIRLFGSNNHLCELKFRNSLNEDLLMGTEEFKEIYSNVYIESMLFYNTRVDSYNDVLTRESIPYVMKKTNRSLDEIQKEIAVDFRACTGHKCPFNAQCTYVQGLRKAKEANIIIGNHSLLLTWPRALEKPPYVIVDEAHKLEGEVTNAFTMEISEGEIDNFAKQMSPLIGPLYYLIGQMQDNSEKVINHIRAEITNFTAIINDHVTSLSDSVFKLAKKQPRYTDIYWNEMPMMTKERLNNPLETAIYNHIDSLFFVFKSIHEMLVPFASRWELNDFGDDEQKLNAWASFERNFSMIESAREVLESLLSKNDEKVSFIKFHETEGYLLGSSPIDVGKIIHENVLKTSTSTVFTSATLANHNGSKGMSSVEWMTGYKYLTGEQRFKSGLFLDNQFKYDTHAKVFIASDVPNIYDHNYVEKVLKELSPMMRDIGGKTLLLFSARTRFDKAIEYLLSQFENEIPLFIQGMGHSVVDDFKEAENGILLGMESFGEGIDIPGDKLKLVYIDKIPDLRRDRVIDARRDFYSRNFGNEFVDYFLATRTRSLHQKFGRLIRRESDSGAIIVTDPRIKSWKSNTLKTFTEMMAPYELEFCDLKEACTKAGEFITEFKC